MQATEGAFLVAAAVLAGALNAIAGGGSFFTFPALVFTGVEPLIANATSAVALWPGSLASAAGYRREIPRDRGVLASTGAASLLGGVAGAVLLVRTPEAVFEKLVPLLLLLATVVFTFGERLVGGEGGRPRRAGALLAVAAVQFVIATYGGYFGGGMGLMMLAAFTLLRLSDIHQMNGLKSLLAVAINGVAIATFAAARVIAWVPALLMTGGAIVGGYGGAALARRIAPRQVRRAVVAIGWALTAYFFVRTY